MAAAALHGAIGLRVVIHETLAVRGGLLEALTWLQRECEDQLGLVKLCSVSEVFKKILEITRLNHRFEVRGGVLETECSNLLKDFFRARRGS